MWYLYFRRIVLGLFGVILGAALSLTLLLVNMQPVRANNARIPMEFPFVVPETGLIAEFMLSYEGSYFEDGSDVFLTDGAALCVYNMAEEYVEYAKIYIETAEGLYCFEGTCIPPKGEVLILEKYRSDCPREPIYFASGEVTYARKDDCSWAFSVQDVDMGRVQVTNLTDKCKQDICLYYKRFAQEEDLYIGGLTYMCRLPQLQAGQSATLSPDVYASGYSKILYITCEQ